ncbi:hypothetical protein Rs2_50852 [Raphanus sativus]|nr:hypothetical protein Rs2_50852 [Raphanus sativus]
MSLCYNSFVLGWVMPSSFMNVAVSGLCGMLTGTAMVIGDFRKDLSRFTTTSASCVLCSIPVLSHLNSLRLQPLRYGSALDGVEFTGSDFLLGIPCHCDARRFSITSSPFTVIVPFVPHLSVAPCDVFNLLVSTILKPRTLVVLVVPFDGLSLTRAGSSVISPAPLSTIYNNPVTDVGGTPLRQPDLFIPPTTANIPSITTVCKSGVRCRWESTPASNFEPSVYESDVRCRWESTPASSVDTTKATVRTGPEGAIETTSVFLVGLNCHSTSLVTISQLYDYVVEALSTHSNLFMNCSQEDV